MIKNVHLSALDMLRRAAYVSNHQRAATNVQTTLTQYKTFNYWLVVNEFFVLN